MTAQIHDSVVWKGSKYLLVGVQGEGMFDPLDHGIETRPTTTANWRGWVATYSIRDDRLLLASLDDVGLAVDGEQAPALNGVAAVDRGGGHTFSYPDADLPIAFTGKLLIAKDFIRDLYVHMGFHAAWKFESSWELTFAEGRLTDENDTTAEMKVVRKRMIAAGGDPELEKPNWIARAFRLDFGRSKGRG